MNEVAAGTFICPVCAETLDTSAPRCFRCTTELTYWWPLEDALRNRAPGPTQIPDNPSRPGRASFFPFVSILLLGALLGFAGGNLWRGAAEGRPTEEVSVSAELSPSPQEEPAPVVTAAEPLVPQVVLYTMQSGDSLWRVAAALTGDGENWRRLWPAYQGREKELRRGTTLDIPIGALRQRATATTEVGK
jgi:hypothetical protein